MKPIRAWAVVDQMGVIYGLSATLEYAKYTLNRYGNSSYRIVELVEKPKKKRRGR